MSTRGPFDDLPAFAERYPHGTPVEQDARLRAFFLALGLTDEDARAIREGRLSGEAAVGMVRQRLDAADERANMLAARFHPPLSDAELREAVAMWEASPMRHARLTGARFFSLDEFRAYCRTGTR